MTWPEIVALALTEVDRLGARLLVVDTLGQFAGLRGDSENDSGAALEAVGPLQAAIAERELAIPLARHDRKSGGDVGESARGSNAWSGAVDCILALRRLPNPPRPGVRQLEAISRRDDVPVDPLLIELTATGYVALGSTEHVALDEARVALLDYLAEQAEPRTEREIIEATEIKRSTWQAARDVLLRSGGICRAGAGKPRDPYRCQLSGVAGLRERMPNGYIRSADTSGPTEPPPSDTLNGADLTPYARAVFGADLREAPA